MNKLSHSQQVLILLPILVIIASALYIFYLTANSYFDNNRELPKIQGFVLNEPQQITNIQLTDHQGMPVNSDYFLGKWHFISYGYTQCPDICPTTLLILTQLADLLSASHENIETQFIFYTIDPDRDSQKTLAQYINYFSKDELPGDVVASPSARVDKVLFLIVFAMRSNTFGKYIIA